MENEILLSIAIPTYNRYQYLEDCLKATCTIESNRMEIIVQDNSEDNLKGLKIIQSINDKRIKYFYTKERVTISENCNSALEKTTGKYVCLLGDDDTVCDNIMDLVEEMEKRNIDTCVFEISTYHWLDLLKQMPALNCFESIESLGKLIYMDPKAILDKELENGLQVIRELPRAYHAIASKYILDMIKEKTGSYFPGPSPDMANAVGCALFSRKHIRIDVPVMVSGFGGNSTGGMGRKHQHKGSLLGKPWLPKNILEIWDKKIPQLWLGYTIWPASGITALKALDRIDLLKKLNYGVIYAEIFLHERDCIRDIVACHITGAETCTLISHISKRVINKFLRKNNKKRVIMSKKHISLIEAKTIQDKENCNHSIREIFTTSESFAV